MFCRSILKSFHECAHSWRGAREDFVRLFGGVQGRELEGTIPPPCFPQRCYLHTEAVLSSFMRLLHQFRLQSMQSPSLDYQSHITLFSPITGRQLGCSEAEHEPRSARGCADARLISPRRLTALELSLSFAIFIIIDVADQTNICTTIESKSCTGLFEKFCFWMRVTRHW